MVKPFCKPLLNGCVTLALNLHLTLPVIIRSGGGHAGRGETLRIQPESGTAALLIIDMQRDFLEPGGFGEMLGNDVSQLRRTIEPNRALLAAWRAAGCW